MVIHLLYRPFHLETWFLQGFFFPHEQMVSVQSFPAALQEHAPLPCFLEQVPLQEHFIYFTGNII